MLPSKQDVKQRGIKINTSSVNNETVSKPAENTFEPSHVGFIVFYAKREETNSKLDIEEGEHQQEVVILTSQKNNISMRVTE